ncbi:MAG: SDR family NAD(P)-dependent oxidoreductase, partial [Paracoccaceae bacterium]
MADPNTLFDLSGRVACVTGASSGLGKQAASALAAAGAQVIGVARRADGVIVEDAAFADRLRSAGIERDIYVIEATSKVE